MPTDASSTRVSLAVSSALAAAVRDDADEGPRVVTGSGRSARRVYHLAAVAMVTPIVVDTIRRGVAGWVGIWGIALVWTRRRDPAVWAAGRRRIVRSLLLAGIVTLVAWIPSIHAIPSGAQFMRLRARRFAQRAPAMDTARQQYAFARAIAYWAAWARAAGLPVHAAFDVPGVSDDELIRWPAAMLDWAESSFSVALGPAAPQRDAP